MDPRIRFRLCDPQRAFQPGDMLKCEFRVEAETAEDIQAVEESVLWYTEGKGDEDFAVHYFHRETRRMVEGGDLRRLRRFETTLPNSPLSYDGMIVKIHWCVRVRVFWRRGKDLTFEQPFMLGAVPSIYVPETS